ncbi:MAG: penicillin-binding protein 2 [Phycisphaerae bacterium]|nr:penicillin-binding protein 2 [Phycisphaerae bacterium]
MFTANAQRSGAPLAQADRVALALFLLLSFALLVLVGRVAQLQIAPSPALAAHMGERTSAVVEPGRRGDITDRRGRLIAATSMGRRAFIDPFEFPKVNTDRAILDLCQAVGAKPEVLGPRILDRMRENERRTANDDNPKLLRYLAVSDLLTDGQLDAVRRLKIPGVHLEYRPVRTVAAADVVGPLLGKVGFDGKGMMGSEKVFDAPMQSADGEFSYVRDAAGRPLWVEPGGYEPPQPGKDVRLAIDLELQRILQEELNRAVIECDAAGARGVLFDPASGEVLAMTDVVRQVRSAIPYDWVRVIPKDNSSGGPRYITIPPDPLRSRIPSLGRNRCVEDIYEPGSTFKPFMWAAVIEAGAARPAEVFNTFNGSWTTPYGRSLHDVVKKDHMTWSEVLINSSNIGMAQGVARLSFLQAHDAIRSLGFGSRVKTGLPGESPGFVTTMKNWSKFTQTSVAYGHEVAVTPLQMVRAFSAFARNGADAGTLPPVRLLAADATDPAAEPPVRAFKPETALLVRETLRGVARNLDRRLSAKRSAEPFRYEIFGKSGTAEIPLGRPPEGKKRPKGSDGYFNGQYNSSFIAAGPYERPRLVCLVVVDDPGPELIRKREHYGSATAGPVVRRVMERALAYLGVPAAPPPPQFE